MSRNRINIHHDRAALPVVMRYTNSEQYACTTIFSVFKAYIMSPKYPVTVFNITYYLLLITYYLLLMQGGQILHRLHILSN